MKHLSAVAGGLILAACLFLSGLTAAMANDAAYIRGAAAPWGVTANEAAMDQVFGEGNWDDLRMADGGAPFSLDSGYRFIFLEGGDATANELNEYLQAYGAQIEAFVNAGGGLLLNAAPNQGGNIFFGFDGAELMVGEFSSNVIAFDPDHPVFLGPDTPVATAYSGNFFGHAILANGLNPIIVGAEGDDQEGEIVLGETTFGNGLVLLGGMTTHNFHSPGEEAANLRANIIAYAAEGAEVIVVQPLPVPIFGPSGLIALMLLMLAMAMWTLRARGV